MLDTGFAFTTLVLLGIPILLIFNLILRRRLFFHLISIMALLYGSAVISVTFFPLTYDSRLIAEMRTHGYGLVLSYNLIPFKSIYGSLNHSYYMVGIRNVLGNLLLLLPFGMLLGVLKIKSIGRVLLYGLSASFAIETLQLVLTLITINTRSVDIDDLILNSVGTLIGYFFYTIVHKVLVKLNGAAFGAIRDKEKTKII